MGGVKSMANIIKIAALVTGLFGLVAVISVHFTSPNASASNAAFIAQEESSADSGETEFA